MIDGKHLSRNLQTGTMTKRRSFLIMLLLASLTFAFCEEPESSTAWSRMITQFGVGSTIGDPFSSNESGFSITIRNYIFLDPQFPNGAYLGFIGGTMTHSAGSVQIGDIRWATLGYRSTLGPQWLSLDASISFVQGSRMTGSTLNGSGYMGISPTLGAYVACGRNLDLGLSVEPVFNVFNLESDDSVRAKNYVDIILFICLKNLLKGERHDWNETVK
jgi:hypothetical protein